MGGEEGDGRVCARGRPFANGVGGSFVASGKVLSECREGGGKVPKGIRVSVGCTKVPCEYCLEKGTRCIVALGPVCANSHTHMWHVCLEKACESPCEARGRGKAGGRGPASRWSAGFGDGAARPLPHSFPVSLFLCLFVSVSAFFFLSLPPPNLQL